MEVVDIDLKTLEMDEEHQCSDNVPESGTEEYVKESASREWDKFMNKFGLARSPSALRREDMVGQQFDSMESANDFYYLYGFLIGFSVRKGQKRKYSCGAVRYRTWMCYKEGQRLKKHLQRCDRIREPKLISREGCKAQLRISYNRKESQWVVTEFITRHSHPLASQSQRAFLRCYRKISPPICAQAKGLQGSNMQTSRILSYMAQLAGGYDRMGFWPKDMENCLHKDRKENLTSCDAAASLGYLQHKAEHDVGFFAKFSYDDDNRLLNLFWSDTKCQQAYKDFGETLAFDTTYKCNQYKNPVTILVGVNHHASTTIFGCCIVGDETVETYTWVLQTFLECMKGKLPKTVVTDGDLAMKSALAKVMQGTVHRLCSWHLAQNATSNVKDPRFLPWFKVMMRRQYDENVFDRKWFDGVQQFGLENNAWVKTLYERRKSWAESFLRGYFFAGMMTTQRCEAMHAFLKHKVDKSTRLCEFIRKLDLALSWQRMMEGKHDFDSSEYRPVIGTTVLPSIEAQVSEIYTQKLYYKVRSEMAREGTYFATKIEGDVDTIAIKLVKYGNALKSRDVRMSKTTKAVSCACNKFPFEGIPCRHIFAALKALQITHLPDTLLLRRWMKHEKAGRASIKDIDTAGMCKTSVSNQATRFCHVTSKTTELAYYASLSEDLEKYALGEIDKLTAILVGMTKTSTSAGEEKPTTAFHHWANIKNPSVKKTKGAPPTKGNKSTRICSNCKRAGHNKATCKRVRRDGNNVDESPNVEPCNTMDRKLDDEKLEAEAIKRDCRKTNRTLAENNNSANGGKGEDDVVMSSTNGENISTEAKNSDRICHSISNKSEGQLPAEDVYFGGTPFGE